MRHSYIALLGAALLAATPAFAADAKPADKAPASKAAPAADQTTIKLNVKGMT